MARVPALKNRVADFAINWQGKLEFNPDEIFPGAMVDELTLEAVLLPAIVHAAVPRIYPVTAATAMLALVSSNLHQHLGEKEKGMDVFGRLLRRLPCYRMDLANDATRNGELLLEFLQHLQPRLPARAASFEGITP